MFETSFTDEKENIINNMNYYVLYCQALKIEKISYLLNSKKHIYSFIPRYQKYIRSKDELIEQVMFPNYLFIKTKLDQVEFDSFLFSLDEERDGIIKELKKKDVSALTDDEIHLIESLLNENEVLVMSEGYQENGKTVVTKGPLKQLQDEIISVNKKDMFAILDIQFLKRNMKAGIWIKAKHNDMA